jgi:hypothetical protein
VPDVFDFNKLSAKQKIALSRALARLIQDESAQPAEVDLSQVPQYYVTHDPEQVYVYRADGEHLVGADGTRHAPDTHAGFTKCPVSGLRLGHAPVAYNGTPITSHADHEGLRRGDASVLARFQPKHDNPNDPGPESPQQVQTADNPQHTQEVA